MAEGELDVRAPSVPALSSALGGRRLGLWVPLVIVIVDQVTKALIRDALALHESMTIVPGILDFTHVRNTGAAFGFLSAADFPYKTAVISTMAFLGLAGVTWYSVRLLEDQMLLRIALALITGGAAGNLIDRALLGSVVDFVDVYWRSYHFWAFNVADSAITIGVALMILDMLGVGAHVSKAV